MPAPVRAALAIASAVLLAAAAGCSSGGGHTARQTGHGSAAPTPGAAPTQGVAPAPGAAPTPAAIVTGPGPKSSYDVQPQPAPGSCTYRYTADKQPLPDPTCTPGAISPAVDQGNINDTICKPGGYTSAIRPPANITGKEKAENAKSYGYTGPMGDAEYDHLISLQLGGDPNDPHNLWVEPPSPGHVPGKGPNNPKDSVETHLHTAICKGQATLAAVQQAIAADWTTAEARLGIKSGGTPTAAADADGD
ncbi:hypothetical protein P3T27_005216 [Kitasatospora sp. MAA19]|uniref:hypothetical protein n=1 Tax=Kitasatospora sp. MAA19 TaxID=3035090 RepID=UPI0024757EED|nr:hypothetical protein [Kitasatospora sp. MAA19]MDH6708476.1 hypothetical protein [Kitasatospora sp. MAA19]